MKDTVIASALFRPYAFPAFRHIELHRSLVSEQEKKYSFVWKYSFAGNDPMAGHEVCGSFDGLKDAAAVLTSGRLGRACITWVADPFADNLEFAESKTWHDMLGYTTEEWKWMTHVRVPVD